MADELEPSPPRDVEARLREIAPGLRPELIRGIALWLGGYSTHAAAAEVGCAQPTLWRQVTALPEGIKANRATYADAAEDVIYPVLQEAWRQTGEKLASEKLSAMQVVTIAGIATDKLVNLGRLRQAAETPREPDGLAAVLGNLASNSGSVTLTLETARTIDVPTSEPGESK